MDEGPFLKDHPHVQKLKIMMNEAGFGSGFMYETGDMYTTILQCVFDARHKNDLMHWADAVRREINSKWDWPILSKPFYATELDDMNPYTSPVVCLHMVPKHIGIANTPFDGDAFAGAIDRLKKAAL